MVRSVIHTASDDSCGGGLGTRLQTYNGFMLNTCIPHLLAYINFFLNSHPSNNWSNNGSVDVCDCLFRHSVIHKLLTHFITDHGCSPLHYAAAGGHAKCSYCLLHHEANLALCNLRGEDALNMAKKNGKPKPNSMCDEYIFCGLVE